ncbi:hypothetical protein [Dictyobacter formicarum]|nr:hypothetical protein [Dictyobacter formicarum]
MLENMLRLLPTWQRQKDVPLQQIRSNIVFGVKSLPIVF